MKQLLNSFLCTLCILAGSSKASVVPAVHWETRSPQQVGLSPDKLDALSKLVGGRGCVVRHGYMVYSWGDQTRSSDVASAFKPVLSTLLLMAVQEGRLKSVDDPVADFEPGLKTLNNGKDGGIIWRHLASQTSGYGLAEAPGAAYSYNDFALTLYYDVLTQKVFQTNGTEVLRTRLAEPLQFEDAATFDAFRRPDRQGRLALSVRDFARFGLLYLRNGRWRDQQLLKPEFIQMAITCPIPASTPLTGGREAEMLPGQHSIGGGKNITPVGPGYYSFNWWLNRTNAAGQRLYVDAPPDAYVASGHGGMRTLWILPGLDLIVCWNDSPIDDHDKSPGNPNTKCNQAARLMVESVTDRGRTKPASKTTLGIEGARFAVNGKPTFLYGISYYGALAARDEFIQSDLDDLQRLDFNWIRVWANWNGFEAEAAAVDGEGHAVQAGLNRLQKLIAECDRRGLVVDVTFSRGDGVTGPSRLQSLEAHSRAVETVSAALQPWRNWYLDLSNERNIHDPRFTSMEDLKALRELARGLKPELLVTASHGGDISQEELREYLNTAKVDFVSPHRPRDARSPAQTEGKTKELLGWMAELERVVPVHFQEPLRRGYANWNPQPGDFLRDLQGALAGGAAGWCFHNGDQRGAPDSQPRRSFDLRTARLFDQLDETERQAVQLLKAAVGGGSRTNWFADAVWYQIFPERFRNGDPANDPVAKSLEGTWPYTVPKDWRVVPWTADWYALQPWEQANGRGFYYNAQLRRYGGDLQGIIDELDYLRDLGVNALYLNPIFESPSLHKYGATMYHHVDKHFGPDPKGDLELFAREDPADPATWRWSAADQLFLKLLSEAHRRHIRVVIDGVFNHVGIPFWAFQRARREGPDSRFAKWFNIRRWDDPATPRDEFDYRGWVGIKNLPEFAKDERGPHPEVKEHLRAVVRRWMDPDGNGDPSDGIDGWRLDVAAEVPLAFWEEFRGWVKANNPDAYLTGEIWWENFNQFTFRNARPWLDRAFDGVMNYRFGDAVYQFFNQPQPIAATEFRRLLEAIQSDYGYERSLEQQNLFGSHDTSRIGSAVVNPQYRQDHGANVQGNREYQVRQPNVEEKCRWQQMVAFQFLAPGAPFIYYGDEAGMWGADDPDCRKPMLWSDLHYQPESADPFGRTRPAESVAPDRKLFEFYRKFVRLRRDHAALRRGDFSWLLADDARRVIAFRRLAGDDRIIAVFNASDNEVRLTAAELKLPSLNGWRDALSNLRLESDGLIVPTRGYYVLRSE